MRRLFLLSTANAKNVVKRHYTSLDAETSANSSAQSTTHFGYKEVPVEEKASMVASVFHSVADNYDIMNDVLSMGTHRLWKNSFVSMADPQLECQYLDVAGGTGDIAFRLLDALQEKAMDRIKPVEKTAQVTVLDINSSMLKVGEDRARQRYPTLHPAVSLRFIEGDAQKLPIEDATIDMYTIAFGIRNVTDIPKALRDAHRVLKPGGRFLCLEFSKVQNPVLSPLYHMYNHNLLPVVGHVVASDWGSYQYLAESIDRFPSQERFQQMLEEAGFQNVTYTNFAEGIVAVHDGWKL
jgi:ubiquinone/menaquinone biosynthesis methyltransferase|uniref:2-methoxy-6-polyprenyl-1,4-benzoquinol methylase, mitochondrial n=1 Tax=Eutreptiella gymnastica TaxID=73025 RepID=A0A7S4G857_9EUGL|mmetsp:Transcript_109460/g.186013  ORF Transcript_109460/g.186013 Transcript_109460/m.186013 type:complete len:295 (-) Transcript_109460:73-957(-)